MIQKSSALWIATVAMLFATAIASRPLSACAMPAEFQIDDVKFADAVVSGEVKKYEVTDGQAILTIAVGRPMTGKDHITERLFQLTDEIKVSWQNSTFQLPETMSQDRSIFALRRVGSARPPLRGASGFIYPEPDNLEFTILQAPCASPFILPYSQMGWDNIQEILDGGSPPSFNYHDPDMGYMVRVWEVETFLKAIVALTMLLLFTNALTLWKYRKMKRQTKWQSED